MLTNFIKEPELSNWLKTDDMTILFYDLPQNFSKTYNSYGYARICTILEGEVLAEIDENILRCDEMKLLIMSPETNVKMIVEKNTKALVFEVTNSLLQRVGKNMRKEIQIEDDLLVEDHAIFTTKTPEFQDVCNRILNIFYSKETDEEYLLNLYVQEMIYYIIRIKGICRVLNIEANQPVNKAIKYIKDNYMLPITIKQISSDLKMSETNFCQYFKKATGFNPKEYLTHIRMEKSIALLLHTSVTDTAFNLGYDNVSRFIAVFKDKYGVTPKQYKFNSM